LNDSIFVDEVMGSTSEKMIYVKKDSCWVFKVYKSRQSRENKQSIFESGLKTAAVNLIEFTRMLYHREFAAISEVLFLAECYPIRMVKTKTESSDYSTYQLKWKVSKGEELVRLHGVHLVGVETENHFIPVGGILKVSFVGLLDIDLIGIIN